MLKKSKLGEKIDQSDAGADKEFEKKFLGDFPKFTSHLGDMRALSAFRREFKLHNYDDLSVFVLAHGRDVSAEQVFAKDEESDVVFYSTSRGVKNALEARGHDAEKKNLSKQSSGERADVFIMLDPDVRVTRTLLGNVAPGGWVLCRLGVANSLRTRGKYEFKAVIEKDGASARLGRRDDPTFWESVTVHSDESFREAAGGEEGVVTYAEAEQKVREAKEAGVPGMMSNNVFKSYTKLIEMAREKNPNLVARGETELPFSLIVKGETIDLGTLNTVLPLEASAADDEDTIIVMKKHEFV